MPVNRVAGPGGLLLRTALRIRSGEFEYEELLKRVEEKMSRIEELYAVADLPETPDERAAERLLVRIREEFYK